MIGTTGHTELERQEIVDAAASIPIVFASNYSVGVNALFWLTRKAAQILGGSCDIEVMEMHHRHKLMLLPVLPGHWRKSCPAPLTGIMKIVWFLAVKGW